MGNKGDKGSAFLINGRHIALAMYIGKNWNDLKARLFLCLLFVFCFSLGGVCHAQSSVVRKPTIEKNDSVMPFKSRWAFRTNAVDWLLLLPNVGVEFDLTSSVYNKITLGVSAKWNWNTSQKYLPPTVYNLFDTRVEVRRYWRTELSQTTRPDSVKVNFLQWLREDVFSRERRHPRYWRSYYLGVYTNLANYSFKFGKEGIQGDAYGFGLSAGYAIPLYGYKKHFIDLELGASVGCIFTRNSKYGYDAESNCYPDLAGSSKGWHMLPYPVITDLRIAFVYRFASIKDKYKLIDQVKIADRHAREMKRKAVNDSVNETRRQVKEEKIHLKKQAAKQKKLEKEKESEKAPTVDEKALKPKKEKKNKKAKVEDKKTEAEDKKMEGGKDESTN